MRKKLLKSQKILLDIKRNEIVAVVTAKNNELQRILNVIMTEQGVPEKELNQWQLVDGGQAIERIKEKKDKK